MSTQDQNKKTLRHFQCRDYLWEIFEQMSTELECSTDYLINEAMRQYARSRNYGTARSGQHNTGVGTDPSARPEQAAPAPQAAAAAAAVGGIPSLRGNAVGRPSIPSPPPPKPRASMAQPASAAGGAASPFASPATPASPQPRMSAPPPAPPRRPSSMPPPPHGQPTGRTTAQMARPQLPQAPPAPNPPPLPGTGRMSAAGAPPAPSTRARQLYIIFNGQKIPVTKEEFVIGRGSKSADLAIKDGNISRRHAAVVLHNGAHYIKDLGSTNGVEYQGRRFDSKRIEEGDVFRICDYELRFSYQ